LARAVLNCWTAAVFVDFVVIFFVVVLSMLPIGNKSALNGGQGMSPETAYYGFVAV
jgi:hypothetical protein